MHKILLAEDDNDMRRFLVKALENAGFQVSSHDNGMSAYQRLREEPFEMLLTDIVMPEMDGIELARRAAELDPDIKIMFITGFAAVALNADSNAPKNAKVLSKPVHLRELVSEVQKMLDHKLLDRIHALGPATLENLSRFIWDRVQHAGRVTRVTVHRDSCNESCSYYGPESGN